MVFCLRSQVRRSSRIQSMGRINYNDQSIPDDEDFVLLSDEATDDEEEDDDLTAAFLTKTDKDWKPLHPEKLTIVKNTRPVRKAAKTASDIVKACSSSEIEDD